MLSIHLFFGFSSLLIFAFLVASVFGRKISQVGYATVVFIVSIAMFFAAVAAWNANISWQLPKPLYLGVVPISLHMDTLSCIFLGLLAFICLSVSLFSPGYLSHLQDRIHMG